MFEQMDLTKINVAEAHCDAPCGIYDPASARIAAEAVVSMTKKIIDLKVPDGGPTAAYQNTLTRYIMVKEEQARIAKEEILILWTDYFKPVHLEGHPNLHDIFWKAAKAASACKVEVSLQHCEEMMDAIKQIHDIFWATKGRDVAWYTAG
jgi:nickel superoxide dismutase